MTLMKSLLLGSAAAIVAVASAQAADLPTKKGAPAAEYVKVCKIGSIAGFILPGSDTCFKISGLVTAQYTYGSTDKNYAITSQNTLGINSAAKQQDSFGIFARARIIFDAVSNTAYGPLLAHIEGQWNYGNGFDNGGESGSLNGSGPATNGGALNSAYIQWAGITAGLHGSFFNFIGGGYAWDNLISPNGYDGNQVDLLAYTATFGGGFSATISAEEDAPTATANAVYGEVLNGAALGTRAPNIVASLDVTQGWGSAHVAGLAHNIHQYANGTTSSSGTGVSVASSTDTWGWGVIGGVSFNLPMVGPGADIKLQGAYLKGAAQASGFFDTGAFNYSGVVWNGGAGDDYCVSVNDGLSCAWKQTEYYSFAAQADLPLGANFKVVPEISYGHDHIPGINASLGSSLSPTLTEWLGGGTLEWTPVKNLVFDIDLLYASGHQDTPQGWTGTGLNAWKSDFSGFNGKLRIERDF